MWTNRGSHSDAGTLFMLLALRHGPEKHALFAENRMADQIKPKK
jgi:hypothetical protein